MARMQAEDGRRVTARPGESVELVLPENPGTGYRWVLTLPAGAAIHQTADGFTPGGTVGGSGTRVFQFQTLGPGEVKLTFALRRAWEEVSPQQVVTVTLDVR